MVLPVGGAAPVAQVFAFCCVLKQRGEGNSQDGAFTAVCPLPGCKLQFSLDLFIIGFIPRVLSGLFRYSGSSRVSRLYF